MAKRAAVVAVNPVNGMGLFQYLETFFENKIPCTVFAVAESREIRTNSGVGLTADDVIAYHLNFSTQSFFGKYFKQHTGTSPSRYKRKG